MRRKRQEIRVGRRGKRIPLLNGCIVEVSTLEPIKWGGGARKGGSVCSGGELPGEHIPEHVRWLTMEMKED